MQSASKVKAEFVVEGVALAAVNARGFAGDALFLYQAGRPHSAAVLAVIAIENVGRGRRMLQQILESQVDPANGQFPVKPEVDQGTFLDSIRSNHEAEIRTGVVCLQFAASSPVDMSEFNTHANELAKFSPGTPEHATSVKQIKRAVQRIFNKATTGFHSTRTMRQYVEPDDGCTVWNEPQESAGQRVRDLIVNAINNYNFLASQITRNDRIMAILRGKGMADRLMQIPFPEFRAAEPELLKA